MTALKSKRSEKAWNDAMLKLDVASAETFLSPDYFLPWR